MMTLHIAVQLTHLHEKVELLRLFKNPGPHHDQSYLFAILFQGLAFYSRGGMAKRITNKVKSPSRESAWE
jgi:hypothetical protein